MRAADFELAGYELEPDETDAAVDGPRLLDGRRVAGDLDVRIVLPEPASAAAVDPSVLTRLRTVDGVVPVVDAGRTATGRPYVVVERWPGADLAARLDARPLSAAEAVVVGRTVGRTLIGAHEAGVVHGALGPRSVVFTDDGRPRLTGFATAAVPADDRAALADLLAACLGARGALLAGRRDVPADVAEVIDRARWPGPGELPTSLAGLVDDLDQLAFRHGWLGTRLGGAGTGRPGGVPAGGWSRWRRIALVAATAVIVVVVVGWLAGRWQADTAGTPAFPVTVGDISGEAPAELAADAADDVGVGVGVVTTAAPVPLSTPTSKAPPTAASPTTVPVTSAQSSTVPSSTAPSSTDPSRTDPSRTDPSSTAPPATGPVRESSAPAVDVVENSDGTGGWQLLADGTIRPFGAAEPVGSGQFLLAPDTTPVALLGGGPRGGLRVVSATGRVIPVADADLHGDLADVALGSPIVDADLSEGRRGYVLLGADGGLFTFGDAAFRGSATGLLPSRAVGLLVLDDSHLVIGRDGSWVRLGAVVAQGRLGVESRPVRSVQRLGDAVVVTTADDRVVTTELSALGL